MGKLLALRGWLAGRLHKPAALPVAGACMTLGFAPFGLWPVAVASLAVLLVAVREAKHARQACVAALLWGMGHGVTGLYWLPWAFFKDSGGDWVEAIGGGVPAVVGMAFYGALAYMLAAWVGYKGGRRYGALGFALTLVIVEMLKGTTPYGFPWLPVGAVWASSVPMMQLASVGGVYCLSALVLLMAVLVSVPTRIRLTAALVLAAVVFGYGEVRLLRAPDLHSGQMVRMVQPNIQSAHKWDAYKRWEFLQYTLAVATAGPAMPPTVVMPETAVAFYLDKEDDVRFAVAERLRLGSAFVTGTVRRVDGVSGTMPQFYNSMAVLDRDAVITDHFDKVLLVPFGEFIPLRKWLERLPLPVTLRTLSQSRLDYSFGQSKPLLYTPAGEAVGLICYEGIFPWHVAKYARGARYLINITNDSWFTGTIALYQHASLARLRAVETGLPLIRVANTGLSVAFDGYGREMARLPIDAPVAADVELPLPARQTLFGVWAGKLGGY